MSDVMFLGLFAAALAAFTGTFGFLIGQLTEASSRRDWVIRHRNRP